MREIFQIKSPCQGPSHCISPDSSTVVIVGNETVDIYDCNGKFLHAFEIERERNVFAIEWSPDGTILSIVYEDHDYVTIWYKSNSEIHLIHSGFKDVSLLLWSPKNDSFILGTKKGNLVICDVSNDNIETILGKHSGEILCGTWTDDGLLVLGSDDNTISFSTIYGHAIKTFALSCRPKNISHICLNDRCFISAELDFGVWFSDASTETSEPVLATFDHDLGNPVFHLWQSNCRSILIGTSEGKFIQQSNPLLLDMPDTYKVLEYTIPLRTMYKYSVLSQSFVVVDDYETIRIISYRNELIEEYNNISIEGITSLDLSRNGNLLLAVAKGTMRGFLVHALSLHCCFGTTVGFISSHREISVVDDQVGLDAKFCINVDPDVLGLGPSHIVVGSGRSVHIYEIENELNEKESKVFQLTECAQDVRVNDQYLAIGTENAIYIHNIKGSSITRLGGGDTEKHTSCFVLTHNFLIYGTLEGDLCFFHLGTMQILREIGLKHESAIVKICSNSTGTVVAFVDGDEKGFLYDTFSHDIVSIPAFPLCKGIMWDQSYNSTFHVYDGKEIHSFIANLTSIRGSHVTKFGSICIADDGKISIISQSCSIRDDAIPIICEQGKVICQSTKDSKILHLALSMFNSHATESGEEVRSSFAKYLVLNCLNDAWKCASKVKSELMYRALANKAIETMNVPIATRSFQQLGEVAIVAKLEEIQYIEEKNLLCGHLAILFGDYDLAETKCLMSSMPKTAFEMRCNFGQWNEALSLAMEYFPNEVLSVSILLANDLELTGDYRSSVEILEQALASNSNGEDDNQTLCLSMIAKTSLKLGNKRKALNIAQRLSLPTLYCDLAEIFEGQDDRQNAAKLYELGNRVTDSIRLWLSEMNLERVTELIRVHTNEVSMTATLYNEYAALSEKMGQFDLAVQAYKSANNIQDAVRLCLTTMKDPKEALEIMRLHPIESVAMEAAKICTSTEDYQSALEFLVLGKYYNEAFELASTYDHVDTLVTLTIDETSPKLVENIGSYYESKGKVIMAANFYGRSSQSAEKALDIFIQHELFSDAIELSKGNDDLAKKLITLFEKNKDDSLEMKIQLYHLYLETEEWNKTLQIVNPIIKESMISLGDYVTAYKIARQTITKLDPLRVGMGSHLRSLFNVLHTYHLAKKFVRGGNHKSAAPLLLRVAKNIDMFTQNDQLNLLISTIIECSKCGFHQEAFKYSKIVCTDERLKAQLEKSSFKRKIHAIVRRPQTQKTEKCTETSLYDPESKDGAIFPICICSGMFLDGDLDWTFCSKSKLPALLTEYQKYADIYGSDPVNGESITSVDLKKASLEEINAYFEYFYSFCEDGTS